MSLRPVAPLGWLGLLWGVGGTALVLVDAVVRLAPKALVLFTQPEPVLLFAAAAWSTFMVWAEGWRGFHQRFNPRVVARSALLGTRPRWALLLGPLVAMGLAHATRRRLVANWLLVGMIVLLIAGTQQLSEGWRAVVDLGVVLGLSVGTVSLLVHTGRLLAGSATPVDPEFPG